MTGITKASEQTLAKLPAPKTDHPFQSAPVQGQLSGYDVEWSGPGWYGLFRRVGGDYHRWQHIGAVVGQNDWYGPERGAIMRSYGILGCELLAEPPVQVEEGN